MSGVLALPEVPAQRLHGAVMTGAGGAATETVVGADDAEQLPYETVTLQLPAALTLSVGVVMPSGLPFLNQAYDVAPVAFAVSVTLLPVQIVALPDGVMVGMAGVEMGTDLLPLFEQVPFVTVTPRSTLPEAPALNVMPLVP